MIPAIYQPATLRAVTRACTEAARIGVAFDLSSGESERFAIPLEDARHLRASLGAYLALYSSDSNKHSEVVHG